MGTFENPASGRSEIEEVKHAVTRQLHQRRIVNPAVLFVGPMLGVHPGWVTSQAEVLADLLSREGYHCLLASSFINRYGRLLHICWEMISKRNEYDIVCLQVYSGPSFVIEDIASWLASLLGKGLVMVLHGGNMPTFTEGFPNWSRRVFMRGSKFVVPSPYLAETLRNYRLESVIIPNLIPIEEYPFRFRGGVSPRLLWMRTFHEMYNPFMAVRVLAEVKRKYPQATLTMAGQDKGLLGKTRALVDSLNLNDSVTFAGFLDMKAKKEVFAWHDIFLNTNRVDNMPVSVIEAAAFGLPVVATAVGGVPFLLEHEKSGMLVPSDHVDAMASQVIRLCSDPSWAGSLSRAGRRLAEKSSWQNVFAMWERVFGDVISGGENGRV